MSFNKMVDSVQKKSAGRASKWGTNDPKNWIAGAVKKPGALHKELGVPMGEKIPAKKIAAAAKKGGKLGERARFAENVKK